MSTVHVRRSYNLESQGEERYPCIPFEVPAGTRSLEVRLRYDRQRGIVDLGCEAPLGWRGWSGGARSSFVIAEQDATPGYSPGPLEPGCWNVVLGLHAVGHEGIDVDIEISLPAISAIEHGARPAPMRGSPRGSTRHLPALPGLSWYAGDFHAHTLHSDGAESVSQVAARAARAGLDFLAITEHNTTSHHRHLRAEGACHGITLIPGQEITTHRGHANAFGDIGFVDFRRPAQAWIDEVTERGGIFSINHPIADDCSWLHPLETPPGAIELWHSTWYKDLTATSALAWLAAWPHRAALVGGSDFHAVGGTYGPGAPTTWVAATDPSPEAIMAAVQAGRTAIMGGLEAGPDVRVPALLTAPVLLRLEDDLVAVDADGLVLVDALGQRRMLRGDRVRVAADPSRGPYCLVLANRQIAAICA